MRSAASPTFRAAPWLRNPHVQTLVSRAARSKTAPAFERTRIETPDGDFLDVEVWDSATVSGDGSTGACLLLHGLEGCARSGYMVTTAAALAAAGVQPVALNFRSCSGEPNRTPGSYHSGQTDDIVRAIEWTRERFPGLRVATVGFSLGGNALLNLLGREPDARWVDAGVAVSVPYDLAACAAALERGLSRGYAHYFMRTLRKKAREKAHRFPDRVPADAAAARTIREFDDRLTAPLHGFRDAADYYARCSAGRHVGAVDAPTLLIQSTDDPLVPGHTVPRETIGSRPNLELRLTPHGGHVGFLDQSLGAGPGGWLERTIAGFVVDKLSTSNLAPATHTATRGSGSR